MCVCVCVCGAFRCQTWGTGWWSVSCRLTTVKWWPLSLTLMETIQRTSPQWWWVQQPIRERTSSFLLWLQFSSLTWRLDSSLQYMICSWISVVVGIHADALTTGRCSALKNSLYINSHVWTVAVFRSTETSSCHQSEKDSSSACMTSSRGRSLWCNNSSQPTWTGYLTWPPPCRPRPRCVCEDKHQKRQKRFVQFVFKCLILLLNHFEKTDTREEEF